MVQHAEAGTPHGIKHMGRSRAARRRIAPQPAPMLVMRVEDEAVDPVEWCLTSPQVTSCASL
jgi:hypothetical protein